MLSFSQQKLYHSIDKGLSGIRDVTAVNTACGTWKVCITCLVLSEKSENRLL